MADILIVEDKESLRTMLRKTLESRGFVVDAVGDAYEARRRLQAARYLVVLTDLKLPAGSGLEVLRDAREAFGRQALGLPSPLHELPCPCDGAGPSVHAARSVGSTCELCVQRTER